MGNNGRTKNLLPWWLAASLYLFAALSIVGHVAEHGLTETLIELAVAAPVTAALIWYLLRRP